MLGAEGWMCTVTAGDDAGRVCAPLDCVVGSVWVPAGRFSDVDHVPPPPTLTFGPTGLPPSESDTFAPDCPVPLTVKLLFAWNVDGFDGLVIAGAESGALTVTVNGEDTLLV